MLPTAGQRKKEGAGSPTILKGAVAPTVGKTIVATTVTILLLLLIILLMGGSNRVSSVGGAADHGQLISVPQSRVFDRGGDVGARSRAGRRGGWGGYSVQKDAGRTQQYHDLAQGTRKRNPSRRGALDEEDAGGEEEDYQDEEKAHASTPPAAGEKHSVDLPNTRSRAIHSSPQGHGGRSNQGESTEYGDGFELRGIQPRLSSPPSQSFSHKTGGDYKAFSDINSTFLADRIVTTARGGGPSVLLLAPRTQFPLMVNLMKEVEEHRDIFGIEGSILVGENDLRDMNALVRNQTQLMTLVESLRFVVTTVPRDHPFLELLITEALRSSRRTAPLLLLSFSFHQLQSSESSPAALFYFEYPTVSSNGLVRWVLSSSFAFGEAVGALYFIHCVSQHQSKREVLREACPMNSTGLLRRPNRSQVMETMKSDIEWKALERAERKDQGERLQQTLGSFVVGPLRAQLEHVVVALSWLTVSTHPAIGVLLPCDPSRQRVEFRLMSLLSEVVADFLSTTTSPMFYFYAPPQCENITGVVQALKGELTGYNRLPIDSVSWCGKLFSRATKGTSMVETADLVPRKSNHGVSGISKMRAGYLNDRKAIDLEDGSRAGADDDEHSKGYARALNSNLGEDRSKDITLSRLAEDTLSRTTTPQQVSRVFSSRPLGCEDVLDLFLVPENTLRGNRVPEMLQYRMRSNPKPVKPLRVMLFRRDEIHFPLMADEREHLK